MDFIEKPPQTTGATPLCSIAEDEQVQFIDALHQN